VALVHDWLVGTRGGERVLDALCELFPGADIFTLIHQPGSVPARIESHAIHTSFLQRVPGIWEHYRYWLPLMPRAAESFDLTGYELVISSSHCVAKGVRTSAPHLSYVHAPMRYMWDRFEDYFGPGRASPVVRAAARAARPALRRWDRRSAQGVQRFVANSQHVAEQIQRLYGREASVVHPFVDLERFASAEPAPPGNYFLWVGALAPYKRVDLALEAFAQLDAPLWIVGPGQRSPASAFGESPRVKWLGAVPDAELPALYRGARALIFPGAEDFGLTPLEAQAAGRPVIAFAAGGALETLNPRTGLFFREQTAAALREAVRAFERWERTFDPTLARQNAALFSRAQFLRRMREELALLPGAPLLS
jgi:glycosyltransferase involved in cell wall biosynthesis